MQLTQKTNTNCTNWRILMLILLLMVLLLAGMLLMMLSWHMYSLLFVQWLLKMSSKRSKQSTYLTWKVVLHAYIIDADYGGSPHLYTKSHTIWDHTVLPATRQQWLPPFAPAKAGTRLIDPWGTEGWVDLVKWLRHRTGGFKSQVWFPAMTLPPPGSTQPCIPVGSQNWDQLWLG